MMDLHFAAPPNGPKQGTTAYWAAQLKALSVSGVFTYLNGVRARRDSDWMWTVQVCRYQGYEVDVAYDLWGAAWVVWFGDSHWQASVDARVACSVCRKRLRIQSRHLLWDTPGAVWLCSGCAADREGR